MFQRHSHAHDTSAEWDGHAGECGGFKPPSTWTTSATPYPLSTYKAAERCIPRQSAGNIVGFHTSSLYSKWICCSPNVPTEQ